MIDAANENHSPAETTFSFEEMLSQLEDEIGYFFRDRNLLRRALTHRSYANEQADPRPPHNEALEFLGLTHLAGAQARQGDAGAGGHGGLCLG